MPRECTPLVLLQQTKHREKHLPVFRDSPSAQHTMLLSLGASIHLRTEVGCGKSGNLKSRGYLQGWALSADSGKDCLFFTLLPLFSACQHPWHSLASGPHHSSLGFHFHTAFSYVVCLSLHHFSPLGIYRTALRDTPFIPQIRSFFSRPLTETYWFAISYSLPKVIVTGSRH